MGTPYLFNFEDINEDINSNMCDEGQKQLE
jgi:hypothetical protein